MKNLKLALLGSAAFLLIGCSTSKDYTPPADASGEKIFSSVCTECHKPLSPDVAMKQSEKVATKEAITKKFQSGSMRMPAFKNIQGDAADRLADYVLSNSQVK